MTYEKLSGFQTKLCEPHPVWMVGDICPDWAWSVPSCLPRNCTHMSWLHWETVRLYSALRPYRPGVYLLKSKKKFSRPVPGIRGLYEYIPDDGALCAIDRAYIKVLTPDSALQGGITNTEPEELAHSRGESSPLPPPGACPVCGE